MGGARGGAGRGEGGVDQWRWWATQLESGRREGRGCRAEDGVREKFRNCRCREGGEAYKSAGQYTYTQYIGGICTYVGEDQHHILEWIAIADTLYPI